ncbi:MULTISPECIES: YqgE/AlgH family protein [Dyella]|uniref:YqgE/AlgH family protein n=1 Tax=Dyella TaxID=231454 RepID=UPI000C814DF8|nr:MULTISPECIES: YqgE/AlgH family protein [Dyella]MDR3444828.1 YqgE/AlgH family protein [Dyella sp.]ULU25117.1 YqgE/AlgH family protein [Dyella terrae]
MPAFCSQPSSLAGQFLIAMPSLAEPPFSRGVAFICQHDEDGAVGLLVNQLSEYRLGDVLDQMKLECSDLELADAPVLIGGPVQQERGFVLHREPGHWESSYRINGEWSVTTSRDILIAMAHGEGPRLAVMALGYAGWSAGQLEQELKDNTWLTVEANERVVFHTPLEERWSAAAGLVGVDPLQLPGYAGHA